MSTPWQARPDRPDAGPFAHRRLADETARLHAEPGWRDGDRNSIALTRAPGLRLVLTALRQGAVLHEHRAPGPMTLHVLSGRMHLRAGDRTLELGPGDLVAMEPGLPHAAEALADTTFLLTLAEAGEP